MFLLLTSKMYILFHKLRRSRNFNEGNSPVISHDLLTTLSSEKNWEIFISTSTRPITTKHGKLVALGELNAREVTWGYVTDLKRNISISKKSIATKLDLVQLYGEVKSIIKSHDSILWSEEVTCQIEKISTNGQWPLNVAGWWLMMTESLPSRHITLCLRILQQGLWSPSLVGWWLRVKLLHI